MYKKITLIYDNLMMECNAAHNEKKNLYVNLMMEYNAVHNRPSDCQKDQIKCVNCVQSLYNHNNDY